MKKWYVVQVVPGCERLVKEEIERRIKEQGLSDSFGTVLIPCSTSKSVNLVDSQSRGRVDDQQLFPGYILVEFDLSDSVLRLITTIYRVHRILGGETPVPIGQEEVDLIAAQVRGDLVVKQDIQSFEVGREIDISGGPFAGFSGLINSIDEAKKRMVVLVSIFGRSTPVEISFDQVSGS